MFIYVLSYAMMGGDLNEVPFLAINLAGTSQDIFFIYCKDRKIIEAFLKRGRHKLVMVYEFV